MSPNVFTVFHHGTAFDRDRNPNEIVTALSRAVDGAEARIIRTGQPTVDDPLPYRLVSPSPTHLICEGPGSLEVSEDDSATGVAHDRPGVFNPLLGLEKAVGASHEQNPALTPAGRRAYWILGDRKSSGFQDAFMGNTPASSKVGGLALGRGWNDNVYKTAWLVQHLKWSEGMPIDTVNLVGWSRGGVTCIKAANKLFEVFEDTLRVNVFAIDPVPGGLNALIEDFRVIPPNVENFVAVLAMDENGSLFEALDRTSLALAAPRSQHGRAGNPDSLNPARTKPRVHFLPFPGNHADVSNAALSSPQVAASPVLVRHLAWKFLARHGTPFRTRFDLDRAEACTMYDQLRGDLPAIAAAARTVWIGSKGLQRERDVSRHRDAYVAEPSRYVNEHHRMCALGPRYPAPPAREERFAPEDWTDWSAHQTMNDWNEWKSGKTIPLPTTPAHLERVGLDLGPQ